MVQRRRARVSSMVPTSPTTTPAPAFASHAAWPRSAPDATDIARIDNTVSPAPVTSKTRMPATIVSARVDALSPPRRLQRSNRSRSVNVLRRQKAGTNVATHAHPSQAKSCGLPDEYLQMAGVRRYSPQGAQSVARQLRGEPNLADTECHSIPRDFNARETT